MVEAAAVESRDISSSGWYEIEEKLGSDKLSQTCAWCQGACSGGYQVVADDACYSLCALCWGRAPAYMEFRQEGMEHADALRRLGTA